MHRFPLFLVAIAGLFLLNPAASQDVRNTYIAVGAQIANSIIDLTTKVTGTLPVANGGTADTGSAWTSYSGSVGAFTCEQTGTVTASAAAARYKNIGKTYWAHLDITETSNSACVGALNVATALPATPNNTATCSAINKSTRILISASVPTAGTNSLQVFASTGAVPFSGNGQFLSVDCTFESQ